MTDDLSRKSPGVVKEDREVHTLRIRLKHLENDLRLTKAEYENTSREYYRMYSHLEELVAERTREVQETQKLVERKARELQFIFDAVPAAIYYINEESRYVRVNQHFADLLGLSIHDIIGSSYRELFPEAPKHLDEYDRQVLTSGTPIHHRTEHLMTTGGMRYLRLDRLPYKDENGELIGLIGFGQDVTELRQVVLEKDALEQQLTRAQRMESLGLLASGIAHDFNNVLAIIAGAAQMLTTEPLTEDGREFLEMITSNISRGRSVTDRIMQFARAGKPNREDIQLSAFLHEVEGMLRHTLSKKVDLQIAQVPPDMYIYGDPGQIQQVVINICINAADAMPGGGKLSIDIGEPSPEIVNRQSKLLSQDYLELRIADTGCGMDEYTLDHVFDPFFTTKEPGQGTGLGLSVAYRIMQQHDGWVSVSSEKGKGTRVNLGIPAGESTSGGEEEEQTHSEESNGEGILFVDDEVDIRELAIPLLQNEGYKVYSAKDGNEALQIMEEFGADIDAVITDLQMPRMDGKTLLSKLKESGREVPVIAYSGHINTDDNLQNGFDALITKPVVWSELLKIIRQVIDSSE